MKNYKWVPAMIGAALGLAAVGALAALAADAPAASARAVVENVTRQALVILRDPALSKDEKSRKVRQIAEQTMDFEVLARLALGQYWRGLTDAQRAQFVQEFEKHVAATYGHTTDEYTDEDIVVASDNKEADGDWTVQTRIMGDKDGRKQEIAKVDYRLRQKEGRWLIIDVNIDGVSLMSNFRSQFQEIMTNGGYDKLIKMLREKNATAPA